jgi:PKHD-type hydroxylase
MQFHVLRLLSPDDVRQLTASLERCAFVDGKATAGILGRDVKDNLQADRGRQDLGEPDSIFNTALQRSGEFQAFAIPRRVLTPTFSIYNPGMRYGPHVDNAIMGAERLRTDLAMTLFLSSPDSYDGGELVIELPMGEQEIKLDAGEAIVYPASTLHRVAPVTRGARLAAITWIESCVADDRLREIVIDLSRAVGAARASENRELALLLSKSYQNLLRYAAQP